MPLVATVHVRSGCFAYRLCALTGGKVVAVSRYIKEVLVEHRVPARAIEVVHNGTDFAERSYPEGIGFREELGIPPGAFFIGLIGRIAREKGQHLAVEALSILKDSHPRTQLVFVGRDSQPEFAAGVKARAAELGIDDRVLWTGPRSDIPRVLDSLDLTILPSEMEACPLSALESMARGVPLVASRRGGLIEMVPHGQTGLLTDLDGASLAAGLRQIMDDSSLLDKFRSASRSWVAENFTNQRMVQGLEKVYASASRKRR
jgi:glycosyltransferase involved in cell wall biosynthesis